MIKKLSRFLPRIILIFCSSFLFAGTVEYSKLPGVYNENIELSLSSPLRGTGIRYRFYTDTGIPCPWIIYTEPLVLTSINGEESVYTIDVMVLDDEKEYGTERLSYRIDKKRPYPPVLNFPQGEYRDDVQLSFISKDQGKIYYSVNGIVLEKGILWDGNGFNLSGEKGKRRDYTIQTYMLDSADNRSDVITYRYTINQTEEAALPPSMTVRSPAPGVFGNRQLLYIDSVNIRNIQYTTDGRDPVKYGILYTDPVMLEVTGNITLKISGMPRLADSFPITKEIRFTAAASGTPRIFENMKSGAYYTGINVVLAAENDSSIQYTLSERTPGESDPVTRDEIKLSGTEGDIVFYTLRARAVTANQKTAAEYRFFYCIHKSLPAITKMTVSGTGPDSEEAIVNMSFTPGADVYYTLDGTIPDQSSEHYTTPVKISRKQAYPSGYLVFSAVAYDAAGKKSAITRRRIAFLFNYPDAPLIDTGKETRTNQDIVINIKGKKNIVYEVSTGIPDPPDPSRESEKALGNIILSAPSGFEKKYIIKLSSTDRDLFTVSEPVRYEFVIDRKPPDNPLLSGAPENGLTREPVMISILDTGNPVYYRITDDNTLPEPAGTGSIPYTQPFSLSGKPDNEIVYRIRALSIDDLNNISYSVKETKFIIDRKNPLLPAAPSIKIYGRELNSLYTIIFKPAPDSFIHYRIFTSSKKKDQFAVYTEPLQVDFSDKPDGIGIEAFSKDNAGNLSNTILFKINPLQKKSDAVFITGVENNGYYNMPVTIELTSHTGKIRYEITEDGSQPPEISGSSPLYLRPITFDTPENTVKEFNIKVNSIEGDVRDLSISDLNIHFVIDKQVPESPRVTGVEHNGYYYGKQTARFQKTSDTVYYELIPTHKYSDILVPQNYRIYEKEIEIDTQAGTVRDFILIAFTVDKAGNFSREKPEWHFTIDKNNVFVSRKGSDTNSGTREQPFATINKAFEYLCSCGRKQIIISSGTYPMQGSIDAAEDLSILGGYNPVTWEPGTNNDRSIIDSSDRYLSKGYLFNGKKTNFSFRNIELRDTHSVFEGFIRNNGGTLLLRDSIVNLENRNTRYAIYVNNTNTEINNTAFICRDINKSTFFSSDTGSTGIFSSTFSGPKSGREFCALIIKNNTDCLFQNSTFNGGNALITGIFEFEKTECNFSRCRIDTGTGGTNATGITAKDSVLGFELCSISCSSESKYSMGLVAENSAITVDTSLIDIRGKSGATGFKMRGGSVSMFRSTMKSRNTGDFLYLFDLGNEKGSFIANVITGSDSKNSVCGVLENSGSGWINNTIIAGRGSTVSSAFIVRGGHESDFINNIIAKPGNQDGDAFHYIGGTKIRSRILNNNISGFENALKLNHIMSGSDTQSQVFYRKTVSEFNMYDNDTVGGNISGNISEDFTSIFVNPRDSDYHLKPASACINSGFDAGILSLKETDLDFDAKPRPAVKENFKLFFDIGAYEYY